MANCLTDSDDFNHNQSHPTVFIPDDGADDAFVLGMIKPPPFADKKRKSHLGRVHLLTLALILMVGGLALDQWWWKIGGLIILIMFVQAYIRYRTMD